MSPEIPSQHRALFLADVSKPLSLNTSRPTPTPGPGSPLIRILAVSLRSNAPHVWQDPESGHPLPLPFVPGFIAIGRVADPGPDATRLRAGQLIFFDPYIIARDDPNSMYVSGFMKVSNEGSQTLATGTWRDSTLTEYALLPTENCHPLDEDRLMGDVKAGGLGYSLDDLTHLFSMLIPFGGLADMDVKAGDTIAIAPATGRYGSAAVHLALAMGAHVIALGRNSEVLAQLSEINPTRISTVRITGDVDADTKTIRTLAGSRGVDGLWDMSPSGAGTATHFRSCLNALNQGAWINLMGSVNSGISYDYLEIVMRRLKVVGTWMCTKEQTRRLIRMVETGVLPLGARAGMGPVRRFGLEEWKEALTAASERLEPGEIVIVPCAE